MSDAVSEFDEGARPMGSVDKVVELSNEVLKLDEEIAALDDLLSAKNKRAHAIKTALLPDAMAELGLTSFALESGHEIKVEDFVSGSLPKDEEKRAKAIKHLTDIDGEPLISNVIEAEFEKNQHNEALSVAEELRQKGFDVTVKSTVHPQTLMAFVREKLHNGEPVEPETLGLFVGRKAKVAVKKEKKKKAK